MSPKLKNNLGFAFVVVLFVAFGAFILTRGEAREKKPADCDGVTVAGVVLRGNVITGHPVYVRVLDLGGYRLAVMWNDKGTSIVQLRGLPESEEDVRPEYPAYRVWTNMSGQLATSYWSKAVQGLVHQDYQGTGALYHVIREEQ